MMVDAAVLVERSRTCQISNTYDRIMFKISSGESALRMPSFSFWVCSQRLVGMSISDWELK